MECGGGAAAAAQFRAPLPGKPEGRGEPRVADGKYGTGCGRAGMRDCAPAPEAARDGRSPFPSASGAGGSGSTVKLVIPVQRGWLWRCQGLEALRESPGTGLGGMDPP